MADAQTRSVSPAPGRRIAAVLLALAIVFHLVQTLRLFPTLGSIVDDRPVIMVDHAIHLYHGALGARAVREHGTTWGYDPDFMAGYPETPVWDSSSNLAIAFQLAAGGHYSPRAYKIGLLVCTLLTVGLVPLAARGAALDLAETAAVTWLSAFVFWALFPISLWRSGLFSFVTASAGLGPMIGLVLAFDRRPTTGRWLALAGAGSVWLFAHVTTPFLASGAACGYALATLSRWRERRGRLLALSAAALVAVATNGFWVVNLVRFRSIRSSAGMFMSASSARYLWDFYRERLIDGHCGLALLILGVAGLVAWWLAGQRLRVAVLGGGVLTLLLLCWLGGLWSVTRSTEPFRFLASLDLLLCYPAGSLLARGAGVLAARAGGGRRGILTASAAFVALGIIVWVSLPRTVAAVARALLLPRPLVIGLRPEDEGLVSWLRKETDISARILFEDQLRLLELTDPESTHWTPLLPLLLGPGGRTFIGGLYQSAFIQHHKAASFGDFGLASRRIDSWTAAELREYVDRYNVGWVVCWSPISRFAFDRYPDAHHVATLPRAVTPQLAVVPDRNQWRAIASKAGPAAADRFMLEGVGHYRIYRLDRPHSYVLEGRGRAVSFDFNRVEFADVEPTAGSVVLSLHWLDSFVSDPPLPLKPTFMPGDPVPFVRVLSGKPVPRLVIRNGY